MSNTETTEFIIVGRDEGTSYTLWDIAPAPTDPVKRDIALEEIGIDAFDAFGSVTTVWATSSAEALQRLLTDLREQSGFDDYQLSPPAAESKK